MFERDAVGRFGSQPVFRNGGVSSFDLAKGDLVDAVEHGIGIEVIDAKAMP